MQMRLPWFDGRARVLKLLPERSRGAEIGVWRGAFSRRLLRSVRPVELHLIDPWTFRPEFPGRWYGGRRARSQSDMDAIHDGVRLRFDDEPAVTIHRCESQAAAARFGDASLDWVYIDGDHSLESVLADLRLYSRKVRRDGFLVLDDFGFREGAERPVQAAVTRWLQEADATLLWIKRDQCAIHVG